MQRRTANRGPPFRAAAFDLSRHASCSCPGGGRHSLGLAIPEPLHLEMLHGAPLCDFICRYGRTVARREPHCPRCADPMASGPTVALVTEELGVRPVAHHRAQPGADL